MLYTIYDVLRVLAAGGFVCRSVGLHGSSVVLYQFIDGHAYPHTDLSLRSFSRLLDTGIIFCAGSGSDDDGLPADFYFLLGQAPLSK